MNRSGFRWLFLLLLSAASLSGCALLHPHRITNPNLPPGYKEQQRAAQKAQKNSAKAAENEAKSRRKRAQVPDADGATDTAAGAAPTATETAGSAGQTASRALPDKPTVKYDKHGLMKKPKLKHRRYYKSPAKPFGPWQKIRNLFRKKPQRSHGKSQSEPKPAPAAPAPAPAGTGLTP